MAVPVSRCILPVPQDVVGSGRSRRNVDRRPTSEVFIDLHELRMYQGRTISNNEDRSDVL
jgi:hypothetical protein